MSDIELLAIGIFVGMGTYISFLRYELGKAQMAAGLMASLLKDIADGHVNIERTADGIRMRKPTTTGEVSGH